MMRVEYLKGSENSINYNQILLDLRRRSEMAYKRFLETGGVNVLKYASELSESILEALDSGLCYPDFDILQFLKEVGKIDNKEKCN
jgi:hypothetical protein